MGTHPASQKLNLVFAWAGALTGLAFELTHSSFGRGDLPRPLEIFFLFACALSTLTVLRKFATHSKSTLGLCAALGFVSTSITFLLVA